MNQHELPTLHSTVGLPRSGKSTWAKQTGWPVVNPDSIRLALHGHAFVPEAEAMVWVIAQYMVKALFLAGHRDVVLDATNITKERRAQWKSKQWRSAFYVFTAVAELCKTRAGTDVKLVEVIDIMDQQFEMIDDDDFAPGLAARMERPEQMGLSMTGVSLPAWVVIGE